MTSTVAHQYDTVLLANGALKMIIWGLGATLAFWHRRGMLAAGFGGACALAALRAFTDAQMPHAAHISLIAYGTTPVAGLIVGSFIGRQPVGARRPAHWAP